MSRKTSCAECGTETAVESVPPLHTVDELDILCDDCEDEPSTRSANRPVADMYGPDDVAYEQMCDRRVPY